MFYPFVCPKCGHAEEISMKISLYTSSGHFCPECKTEMKRDPKSLVCGLSVDSTGDFFRKCN